MLSALSQDCLFLKVGEDCPLPQASKSVELLKISSVRQSLSKSGQSAIDFIKLSATHFARHCLQLYILCISFAFIAILRCKTLESLNL